MEENFRFSLADQIVLEDHFGLEEDVDEEQSNTTLGEDKINSPQ